jgi:NTP pyrophosphatase (non-canonical NTP hydrolase)
MVMDEYRKSFPDVKIDRDYLPFKITEEWGECLQAYLMLTDRGKQKNKSKQEIKNMLSDEFADVFAYLLLFAESEGIDPAEALEKKWFKYL